MKINPSGETFIRNKDPPRKDMEPTIEDFILTDEDLISIIEQKYITKLNVEVRQILNIESEDFINIEMVINLINGVSSDPSMVMRSLLKLSFIVKVMIKSLNKEYEDKQIILEHEIAKLKHKFSLQDDSNPYHGKLKITIESLNNLIDMNNSVTALRRVLIQIKSRKDFLYVFADLIEKEIDICRSLLYTFASNPELKGDKVLSSGEIEILFEAVQDKFNSIAQELT